MYMKPFSDNLLEQEFVIQTNYLAPNTKRRSGLLITPNVRFIVAHDTGNPESTAIGNVKYYERSRNEISASAHLFVDHTQIIECIPALTGSPEKAWHVLYSRKEDNILYGHNSNDAAIGVEYCFGKSINADEAYRRYVWVIAFACWKFKLDPRVSVIGHHILDPHRKIDPVNGLSKSRRSYTQMLKDVVDIYIQGGGKLPPQNAFSFPIQFIAQGLLNIRSGEPYRRARVIRQVAQGTSLLVQGIIEGENVNGINKWCDLGNNEFCWSGAVA
jgi:N-acetylmuramoyl-L-alanine amidase